jgi:hypothetical protein
MKKLILISLAFIFSYNVIAQDSGIGIGVILGDPTGFSAKFWMNEKSAVDAALGFEFNGYISLHADFLYHHWSFDIAQDKMLVFFGGGPAIGIGGWHYAYWDDGVWRDGPYFNLGIRAPGGVAWHFHQMPLECFVEVAPRINIIHHYRSFFTVDGGVGARWYF